jgi:hypothetical protein
MDEKTLDFKHIFNNLISDFFVAAVFAKNDKGEKILNPKLTVSFLGLSDADEVINMRLLPKLESGYVKVWHRWMASGLLKPHQVNDFKIKLARLASSGDNGYEVAAQFMRRLLGLKGDDNDTAKTDFVIKTEIVAEKSALEIPEAILNYARKELTDTKADIERMAQDVTATVDSMEAYLNSIKRR